MSASKGPESPEELRLAERLARDFDAARLVRAGDDELVLRATARALSRPSARRRGKRGAMLLAAATLLALGSAAAAASVWVATRAAPVPGAAESDSPAGRMKPARATGASQSPSTPALAPKGSPGEVPEPEMANQVTNPSAASPPTSRRASGAPAPSAKTAASLFQEASAARHEGDLRGARALYLELEASFANSNEAHVSHVSLGKLLLGSGHAQEAERQFRDYLALGGGELRAEALVGRAEALGQLGRSAEERRLWQEILQQHPSSVYAPRARRRLGELGAAE